MSANSSGMDRRAFMTTAAAGAVGTMLSARTSQSSATTKRPNLVIMLTDDQRDDAMSCAGNSILKTPNMDRIAKEGVRFRNSFVTNSLCCPSRATLMTGQYSHTHGVVDNNGRQISPDQKILPDLLREAGYEVAFVGKSHIKGFLRDRQWDHYVGFPGQGEYLNPKIFNGVTGEAEVTPGYMDDILGDRAVEWLKGRGEKPFCLFLFFKGSHGPWFRPRRLHDLYNGVKIPKPKTYDDDLKGYPGGKPTGFQNANNKVGERMDVLSFESFVKGYYSTLKAVDDNIGRVIKTLEETKKLDDTALLFTSDNGFFQGEWRCFDKRLMHEPSIRVPFLIRYPGVVRSHTVEDRMALNIDIAPTVLDLAGVAIPDWMHGKSVLPLLKGEKIDWRKDWLYEYFEFPNQHDVPRNRGVRTERYKLIHYYERDPQEFELYDLHKDPGELINLYGRPEFAELTAQLMKRIEELRKETGDLS